MSLARWDPFTDLMNLREAVNRLFEESFVRPGRGLCYGPTTVPVDMYHEDGNLVVKASVPGVKPEDIDVSVMGNTLTIKGEMKEDREVREENVIRRERCVGTFSRSMTLPNPVDTSKAQATFENGVLTLMLPPAEEAKPKEIKVKAG